MSNFNVTVCDICHPKGIFGLDFRETEDALLLKAGLDLDKFRKGSSDKHFYGRGFILADESIAVTSHGWQMDGDYSVCNICVVERRMLGERNVESGATCALALFEGELVPPVDVPEDYYDPIRYSSDKSHDEFMGKMKTVNVDPQWELQKNKALDYIEDKLKKRGAIVTQDVRNVNLGFIERHFGEDKAKAVSEALDEGAIQKKG